MTTKEFFLQEVNPAFAWFIILGVSLMFAIMCYSSAKAMYAEQTAAYESQAKAYELQQKLTVQQRIGTGAFIKAK